MSSYAHPASVSGGISIRSPLLRVASDERLIVLIRRGREDAFEVLVERYRPRLVAFCQNMLRSPEDAEDVMQEVMVSAHRAIRADDRQIVVKPWLYRIARNRCLNHMRRVQPIALDTMDEFTALGAVSAPEKVERSEQLREIVADVKRLPESQQTALLLREMEGLPYAQIAEVLDTTVPSVKSLLVRARVGLAEAAEARTLTCPQAASAAADRAATEAERRAARRHLRECGDCGARVAAA
jgi:RNA polymerase sigma factor (sigma-70 family)